GKQTSIPRLHAEPESGAGGGPGLWGSGPRHCLPTNPSMQCCPASRRYFCQPAALSRRIRRAGAQAPQLLETAFAQRLALSVHVGAAMAACVDASLWQQALSLKSDAYVDAFIFGSAFHACQQGLCWKTALALLEEMPSLRVTGDRISMNSCLSAVAAATQWERTLALLQQGAFDVKGHTTAISSCGTASQWRISLSLLGSLYGKAPLDVACFNACISACENAGMWEAALQLLSQMQDATLAPNTTSLNACISVFAVASRWEMALLWFFSMPQLRLEHDMVSLGASISACEKGAQWQLALHFLGKHKEVC
ncbi:unnamed protein product, partial [Effrenium voratum]